MIYSVVLSPNKNIFCHDVFLSSLRILLSFFYLILKFFYLRLNFFFDFFIGKHSPRINDSYFEFFFLYLSLSYLSHCHLLTKCQTFHPKVNPLLLNWSLASILLLLQGDGGEQRKGSKSASYSFCNLEQFGVYSLAHTGCFKWNMTDMYIFQLTIVLRF